MAMCGRPSGLDGFVLPIPKKNLINQSLYEKKTLELDRYWVTILGFQFETLILSNLNVIIEKLKIKPNSIISASPHIQRKTSRTPKACQIDLLINTKKTLFISVNLNAEQKLNLQLYKKWKIKLRP